MSDFPPYPVPRGFSTDAINDRADISHSEAKIRQLVYRAVEATNNAVMIIDSDKPDNPIIYANEGFERLSGYTIDEVLGYNCRLMQYRSNGMRDQDQEGVKVLRWAVRHKKPARVILRNYRKSGEKFWNELYLSPFADEETGEARYFVSIQREITDRIEHNQSFEREVAVRIQALKEERDELKRTRETLVRNMNREIRDTLTTILGLADLIQRKSTTDALNEYTVRIKGQGTRLMNTLSSLQELTGMQDGELAYAAVAEVVRDAVEQMQESTTRDPLPLTVTIAPEAGEAVAQLDAERVTTVLQTLITTVLLRTGAEGGMLRVYTTDHSGRPCVAVDVEGKGVEINEELHPFLFEDPTHESGKHGSEYDGSGISLSVTRDLVQSMNGTLILKSTSDGGTTFTMALPRVPEQEPIGAVNPSTDQGEHTVLIVEDNEDTVFLLKSLLQDTADILTSLDAADAIQQAQDADIDLFLVDINLGAGGSGTDVLEQLRAMDRYYDTPIVAVTAIAMRGDKQRFLDQGFDDYLAKPFTADALIKMVERYLS